SHMGADARKRREACFCMKQESYQRVGGERGDTAYGNRAHGGDSDPLTHAGQYQGCIGSWPAGLLLRVQRMLQAHSRCHSHPGRRCTQAGGEERTPRERASLGQTHDGLWWARGRGRLQRMLQGATQRFKEFRTRICSAWRRRAQQCRCLVGARLFLCPLFGARWTAIGWQVLDVLVQPCPLLRAVSCSSRRLFRPVRMLLEVLFTQWQYGLFVVTHAHSVSTRFVECISRSVYFELL